MAEDQERLTKPLGNVDIATDDRLRCIALEHDISPDELLGWVVGIGAAVLEARLQVPNGRLYLFDGAQHGRRITLPDEVSND